AADDLPGSRALEPLRRASMCFQFRHLVSAALFTLLSTLLLFGGLFRFPFRRRTAHAGALRGDRVHLPAFLTRRGLGNRPLAEVVNQTLENAPPDLGVRHLAAAEEDRCLDLVALGEEALDVLLLELIVVLVDLRPKLDLLDLDDL